MTDAPELLLAHHLKTLRLPTFLREHDKQARQAQVKHILHSDWGWPPAKKACLSAS
jgi:hypothetical protein